MDKRRAELSEISSYIRNVDNEVTLILQSLQWDRNYLLKSPSLVLCKYDHNHKVPPDKLKLHEEGCRLRSLGYSADELLLPEPLDVSANTLVTLSNNDIADILDAANINTYKKGIPIKYTRIFTRNQYQLMFAAFKVVLLKSLDLRRTQEPEPLSLQRLQIVYSGDERRAIHDAVVAAAPACHDLQDLALPSGDGAQAAPQPRTRLEILAELRDMKRRRTKYRVAPKTRNYSDVLRDVISTQMEHFSEIRKETDPETSYSKTYKNSKDNTDRTKEEIFKNKKYDEVHVKREPIEDESLWKDECHRKRETSKKIYKEREREKKHDDYDQRSKHRDHKHRHSSSSKEKSKDQSYYRGSDKYRKENYRDYRKEYKEHSSTQSRTSDVRDKRDSHKSHRDEHRRYYDYKEDELEAIRKRIKREKD